MRRRGWGRRASGGTAIERLRELRGIGLRDLAPSELEGTPDGIGLGLAHFDGRPVAVVASRRPGEDLIGWAHVAARHTDTRYREVVVAAPAHPDRVRHLAARAADAGLIVHLLTAPGLAESTDELFELASYPDRDAGPLQPETPVYEKVLRVIDGAVAVTSSGGVRRTSTGAVVYVRGELVARVQREAEGVAISMLVPEKQRIFVNASNFPRWGVELHEMIVKITQDPRLASDAVEGREQAAEAMAQQAGASITARWLPCSPDGESRIDWVGVDAAGHPAIGLISESVRPVEAATLVTAYYAIVQDRTVWAPGSAGRPRVHFTGTLDFVARAVIDALVAETPEPMPLPTVERPAPRPSRSRPPMSRRSQAESEDDAADSGEEEGERSRDNRRPRRRSRRRRRGSGRSESGADEAEADAEEPRGEAAEDETEEPEVAAEAAGDSDAADEAPVGAAAEEDDDTSPDTSVTIQMEEALAEGEADEPEEIEEPPRRRRSRATVVAHDDEHSILAALVLARDRRQTTSFRVVRQEGLMDFFKGPANDVSENEDLLVVGFTAQPHVRELLDTAELFRGRLQWFDHHDWPIEDLERLRAAVGRDSILIEAGATPLHAVNVVTERRSRFTDKLIELSARRLSDKDMAKWGFKLMGLIQRLAKQPGEHRPDIGPVLAGKPSELPDSPEVYAAEAEWIEQNDPRMVHFGEYDLAVVEVPTNLDPGEVARRVRGRTGARLSLSAREGENLAILGCNDEKRPLNVAGMAEVVGASVPWAHAKLSGDRLGWLQIEDRTAQPERMEQLIGEIVRHRSVLYG